MREATSSTTITTTTTLRKVVFITTTSTLTPQIQTIYKINEINRTIPIDKIQEKEILNLKPEICFTQGCNIGFYESKRLIMEILKLKIPPFKEHTGLGYDPFFKFDENLTCFNQEFDKYGNVFLTFNNSIWDIFQYNKSFTLTRKYD